MIIRPGDIYKIKNNNIYGFEKGEIFMVVTPNVKGYEILYYPMSSSGVWLPRTRVNNPILTIEQIENMGKKISSLDRCVK